MRRGCGSEDDTTLIGTGLTWPRQAQPSGRASSYLGGSLVPVLQALHQGRGRPGTTRQEMQAVSGQDWPVQVPTALGEEAPGQGCSPGLLPSSPRSPRRLPVSRERPETERRGSSSPFPTVTPTSVCSHASGCTEPGDRLLAYLPGPGRCRWASRGSRSKAQPSYPTSTPLCALAPSHSSAFDVLAICLLHLPLNTLFFYFGLFSIFTLSPLPLFLSKNQ